MTYGAGGHTDALLLMAPGATVYCLDRDPYAHDLAQTHAKNRSVIESFSIFFIAFHRNHKEYH